MQKKENSSVIAEINGVDERNYKEIKITLMDTCIIITKDNRKKKYPLSSINDLGANSSRLWFSVNKKKKTLLNSESLINNKSQTIDFEQKIQQCINNIEFEMQSNLQGAAKREEKKYKKSYRIQIVLASIILAIFVFILTLVIVMVQQQINTKETYEPKRNEMEFAVYQEEFLDRAIDQLLKTKSSLSNIENLIDNEIMLKEENFTEWLNTLMKNKEIYSDSIITNFIYDNNYSVMTDEYVKTSCTNIYSSSEDILNSMINLLKEQNKDKSLYLDIKQKIEEVKTNIDELIRKIIAETN